jgi:hypothetical protein
MDMEEPEVVPRAPMPVDGWRRWRALLIVAALLWTVPLTVIAVEQHRQVKEERAAGCFDRITILERYREPATQTFHAAASRCLGVPIRASGRVCVSMTKLPEGSSAEWDAFLRGVGIVADVVFDAGDSRRFVVASQDADAFLSRARRDRLVASADVFAPESDGRCDR